MKHYPHAIVQKNYSISYRTAFPYVALCAMIAALFLVYIITSASMTSAEFSLKRVRLQQQETMAQYNDLVRRRGDRRSLEYVSEATASLGLTEIRHADYLELQESGIVVTR